MGFQIGVKAGEAGTTAKSSDGAPIAARSPFGSSLALGAFEWGGAVHIHSSLPNYKALRGDALEEDPTAVCCEHFYQAGESAGRLATIRVMTADAIEAWRDIYGRDIATSYLVRTPFPPPTRVLRMEGLYAGKRGGRYDLRAGLVADAAVAMNIGAATFATGITMLEDQFKDALLYVQGISRAFRVSSNSTAGVLSIQIPSGFTEPAASPAYFYVELQAQRSDGKYDGFGFQLAQSNLRLADGFSLSPFDARAQASSPQSYDTAVLDPGDELYLEQRLARDGQTGSQNWLAADVQTLPDPLDPTVKPAHWVGFSAPGTVVANSLTLLTHYWTRTSPGGGNAYLDPASITYGASAKVRMRALCTFTSATAFTVKFQTWNGDVDLSGTFTGFSTGTAASFGVDILPGFKLIAGTSPMAATNTMIVYFHPLPENIAASNGKLYPFATGEADGNMRLALPVRSNTRTTVALASSIDLEGDHAYDHPNPAGWPAGVVTAGPYDLTSAGDRVLTFQVNGETAIVLTSTLSGAAETAAALAADLTAVYAATTPAVNRVIFGETGGKLTIVTRYDFGPLATLSITNTGLGPVLGFADTTVAAAAAAVEPIALSYIELLERGRSGLASLGAADEYLTALDVNTSPARQITREGLGLVKMMMPGVSGGDEDEQNAAMLLCKTLGWKFVAEQDPTAITNQEAAAAHARDTLAGYQVRKLYFDSYGYPRRQPFRGVESLYPLTGALLGVQAKIAVERNGYHIQAAGKKANIGTVFRDLASSNPLGSFPIRKDERLLNQVGISAIQQDGPVIYPNGGRNSDDAFANTGVVWDHKIDCVLHILQQMIAVGDLFTWEDNSPETRSLLQSAARPILEELFIFGWFARESTQKFEDVVIISAGEDLNPASVQAIGEMRMTIELVNGIVGAVERVVISVGTGGVAATFGSA